MEVNLKKVYNSQHLHLSSCLRNKYQSPERQAEKEGLTGAGAVKGMLGCGKLGESLKNDLMNLKILKMIQFPHILFECLDLL